MKSCRSLTPARRWPAIRLSRAAAALVVVMSGSVLRLSVAEPADHVPADLFFAPDGLEVRVWARSPMFHNPTSIDIDEAGRIWVAEGVNYRSHRNRQPEGDRIVVLEDKDGDGAADSSHVFVQERFLEAPLGVAVFDNRVVVSMTPQMIVYTDVDRDLRFDPAVDRREVLLDGFENRQHDHTLHSVTGGPDGEWYWNCGNCGGQFTDRSGRTFRISGAYERQSYAGEPSDDGHVYVGGFTARMKPDGTRVRIIGHNYRNSYEQAVTSFGDVFQNDNDDPPACRVSFVPEYGNAGFSSFDGARTWQADRRPWQTVEVAQWRQEDPGTMPSGDVYGGGSPTGIVHYENGALGPAWEDGVLLSCEAGRNVVFGYHPEPDGAGYRLERFDFVGSNPAGAFAGSDFLGGGDSVRRDDLRTHFRPSDVAVGPDGAVYVADWFDARVGGHQDLDESLSGTIYRIAPTGFVPRVPPVDRESIEGLVELLRNPAVNVRFTAQEALAARGPEAVAPVAALLGDANRFVRARAVWMLARLGSEGTAQVEALLEDEDPMMRVAAFRALRRQRADDVAAVGSLAAAHASDPSPAMRREVALAMRDLPADPALPILAELAAGFDGTDRAYLDALGTGATQKEDALWDMISRSSLAADRPVQWSAAFSWITWRLHPEAAVPDLARRAGDMDLDPEARKLAIDTLAFIPTAPAAAALLKLAIPENDPLRDRMVWWLIHRNGNAWSEFAVLDEMRRLGIHDPQNQKIESIVLPPEPERGVGDFPPAEEVVRIGGNAGRGRLLASRCIMCHQIDGSGVDYGPALGDFALTQPPDVIVNAIVEPSAAIALGYEGFEIVTNDDIVVHGMVIGEGDPLIVKSTGGRTQMIARDRIRSREKLGRSLMLSAAELGLTPADVADLVAHLQAVADARRQRSGDAP